MLAVYIGKKVKKLSGGCLDQLSLASLWGSQNRVPALIGWGKGRNITSAGWQVTLCDPIWHINSHSGEICCNCYIRLLYFTSSLCPLSGVHLFLFCLQIFNLTWQHCLPVIPRHVAYTQTGSPRGSINKASNTEV